MILVMGNKADPVIGRLTAALVRAGASFASVDEGAPGRYDVERSADDRSVRWAIRGGDCVGRRSVGAIFVRHEETAPDRTSLRALAGLRRRLDRVLLSTICRVINRPSNAAANFSKPYQLRQMAAAGFLVPRTLVTNDPSAALSFIAEIGGKVLFKGVSNLKTVPQPLKSEHLKQLSRLKHCPTQFQEFIDGEDFRVTVVDALSEVTSLVGGVSDFSARTAKASLPASLLKRCIRFTRAQGLVMGGIDVRRTPGGDVYAFELNPYPLFTYHEPEELPRITRRVVEYLAKHQYAPSDVRA